MNRTAPNTAPPDDGRDKNNTALKPRRRELRSHGTAAEGGLWRLLRNRQVEGLRFRRQFSVSGYILDFYCPEILLAIELDGDNPSSLLTPHS